MKHIETITRNKIVFNEAKVPVGTETHTFMIYKERGMTSESNLFGVQRLEPRPDGKVHVHSTVWRSNQGLAHRLVYGTRL